MWGQVAGAVLGGLFGSKGQSRANQVNIAMARENRAWQERMSNTAYQRSANDLEKAGLNRILALGSPGSTPAGNMATVGNVGAAGVDGATKGATTALAVRRLSQELKNMKAAKADTDAGAALKETQGNTELAKQALIEAQAKALKGAAEAGDIVGDAISTAKDKLTSDNLDWSSMWERLKQDATKARYGGTKFPRIKWYDKLKERAEAGRQEAIEYRRRQKQ